MFADHRIYSPPFWLILSDHFLRQRVGELGFLTLMRTLTGATDEYRQLIQRSSATFRVLAWSQRRILGRRNLELLTCSSLHMRVVVEGAEGRRHSQREMRVRPLSATRYAFHLLRL